MSTPPTVPESPCGMGPSDLDAGLGAVRDELAAVQAIWADIAAPGGHQRLIERATDQKERLRRCEDGGYTAERTKQECGEAAFIISQLTTALSTSTASPADRPALPRETK